MPIRVRCVTVVVMNDSLYGEPHTPPTYTHEYLAAQNSLLSDLPDQRGPRPGGVLIAGYGAYISPSSIMKIDVSATGNGFQVVAWLNDPSTTGSQAKFAALTAPLDSEAEAFKAADRICLTLFDVFSADNPSGAVWPAPVS